MKVSGSGSGEPTDLVAFPGAYTADTPGVVFDVYQDDADYPVRPPFPSIIYFGSEYVESPNTNNKNRSLAQMSGPAKLLPCDIPLDYCS